MGGLNAPCMNCEKKGCGSYHSQCEKFKKFQEELEKVKQLKKKKNIFPSNFFRNSEKVSLR